MNRLRNITGNILTTIKSCRIRIILILAGLFFIIFYRVLIHIPGAANYVYKNIIHPLHNLMASACDLVNFSVCEILVAVCVCCFAVYLAVTVYKMFKNKIVIKYIIDIVLAIIMIFNLVYGGFCILWGVYYSATDMGLNNLCGLSANGVTHEALIAVDKYFAELANEYSSQVKRDSNGCYVMDEKYIFEHALSLYDNTECDYPALKATPHKPKSVYASIVVSYMDFSGFYFPFTAEANINTDEPDSSTPSVIAHELAHQRGIAREDEANFMAVLACMNDGDPEYVYSASLMALTYLQNALYKSGDKDTWMEICDTYSDGVYKDLEQRRVYWNRFSKTVANKVTNSTYDSFLKSYDQELGIETYGRCVDLLVNYFFEKIE